MSERRILGEFIDTIERGQIAEVLSEESLQPVVIPDPIELITTDFPNANRLAPLWLNLDGLVSVGNILNSPVLWRKLLKTQDRQAQLRASFDVGEPNTEKAADKITNRNRNFSQKAISVSLLATAMGDSLDIDTVSEKYNYFNLPTGFDSAKEITEIYPEPVNTPEELYERFCQLFPPDDANHGLFGIFLNNDEFEGVTAIHCPAPTLVKTMFEEYGKIIRTEEFKKVFEAAVVKPVAE
ncbi:MAG TPA: hypothetical protein VHE53_05570 [Patescibacteria group bacterium]|nr:hypothetical protein [Patescibacteria group bacterium]